MRKYGGYVSLMTQYQYLQVVKGNLWQTQMEPRAGQRFAVCLGPLWKLGSKIGWLTSSRMCRRALCGRTCSHLGMSLHRWKHSQVRGLLTCSKTLLQVALYGNDSQSRALGVGLGASRVRVPGGQWNLWFAPGTSRVITQSNCATDSVLLRQSGLSCFSRNGNRRALSHSYPGWIAFVSNGSHFLDNLMHVGSSQTHFLHMACGVTKIRPWCLLTHCASWQTQKGARWKFHNLKKDINEDTEAKGSNTGCCLLCKSSLLALAKGLHPLSAICKRGAICLVQIRTTKLREAVFNSWWTSEQEETLLTHHQWAVFYP